MLLIWFQALKGSAHLEKKSLGVGSMSRFFCLPESWEAGFPTWTKIQVTFDLSEECLVRGMNEMTEWNAWGERWTVTPVEFISPSCHIPEEAPYSLVSRFQNIFEQRHSITVIFLSVKEFMIIPIQSLSRGMSLDKDSADKENEYHVTN